MNTDKILKLFVDDEKGSRIWMQKPNEQNEFVYATDANTMVRIPVDKLLNKYPAHERTPDFQVIMNRIKYHNPVIISKDGILKTISTVELVEATVECKNCEGNGYVECDLGHEHDCAECIGKGFIPLPDVDKVFPKDEVVVKIGDVFINPLLLIRLVQIMDLQGVKEVEQVGGIYDIHTPQFYKVGVTEVILMPLHDAGGLQVLEYELEKHSAIK